jgi:hypothetical protein
VSRQRTIATWIWLPTVVVGSTLRAFYRAGLGWLAPVVVFLFLVVLVLALLSSAGVLAPFVYPLL